MSYETFEMRFAECSHTMKIPLLHSSDHVNCYIYQPELRDQPTPGKCPACASADRHKQSARGAGA
jgi:hypothetical protein